MMKQRRDTLDVRSLTHRHVEHVSVVVVVPSDETPGDVPTE